MRHSKHPWSPAVHPRSDPKFAAAHFNLGVALVDMLDPAGAMASLREAVHLEPNNAVFVSGVAKLQAAMAAKKPKEETTPPPKEGRKP
jgi:cytochrome c-type biogenesis protein CcmH/NrfG